MLGLPRRPLAAFVCCFLAGIQVAPVCADPQLADSGEAVSVDEPLRLRSERRFNVLGKRRPLPAAEVGLEHPVELNKDDSYPMFIVADRIEGRPDDTTDAEGNVELRKAGSLLLADRLNYRPLDDEVDARGHVRILQEGAEVRTPHLRMRLDEQLGFAEEAEYLIVKDVASKFYRSQQSMLSMATGNGVGGSGAPMMLNVANAYGLPTVAPARRPSVASGDAVRIDFEGENQIRLSQASYSTCKPGDRDWYLKADEIQLDYDNNSGEASDASLWFKDVPIFYTPLAGFSLNNQRRSGFLHPTLASSTTNGMDLSLPFYWNIAPNYDMTLYPRFMSKRGFQLGSIAEYLDHNYKGTFRGEYLPNDDILQRERYAYYLYHRHNLGQDVSATITWNAVSDDNYWQDMSSRLMQTSQTQLQRQLALNYSPSPWWRTSMRVLNYQTLQVDPLNRIERPYFLEPQFTLSGYKPDLGKADFSLLGQYSRFTHPDKVNGERLMVYPQLSLPIVNPAFQIIPKIGIHATQYNFSQQAWGEPTSATRVLPTFSLDGSMVFERETRWLDTDYLQTLEPRLYYVNIPYKDQRKIPLFDTALSDFNFAQIFGENRYSGFDRVNDANQLTAALTSRLIDAQTGVERFKAMIGQRYYFQPQRVSITGENQRQADFSNLVAAVSGLAAPKTYVDAAWEYNYRDDASERFALGMRYQPDFGRVLSASYRYTRDPLTNRSLVDQVDLAGQWPLGAGWYAVGRYNFSLRDSQLLEAIGGLEYNAGCWAARFVAQRLEALAGAANTTFFLQLELNDFASVGSNPLQLLRRSIPGFGKINELPTSGSLLTTQ